jgi:hypothetical protein
MVGSRVFASRKWSFFGLALIAFVTAVVAAPIVGSGPYSLPSTGTPPKDIWNGPASSRCGAKVRGTTGTVRVQGTVAGVATNLGQVSAGVECVFEGKYDKISLVGVTCPAEGTFEVRAPTDGAGADSLVGGDTEEFPAPGGTIGVYASSEPMRRLVSVRASGGPVSIRSTRTGSDLVTIDGGDWSFAIRGAASAYFLSAPAAATAVWEIHDVQSTTPAISGTCSGKAGDVDAISVDAACPLAVTLTNPGPALVRVTRQLNGQAATTQDVPVGGNVSASGPLTRFDWTYVDTDPARSTTVTLSATSQ